jgi:hypothetical protein
MFFHGHRRNMFAGLDLANCEAQRYDEVYPLKMYTLPVVCFARVEWTGRFPKGQ